MWIDTHAHLDKLKNRPEDILTEASRNQVKTVFTIGTNLKDWPEVLRLAEAFPNVYGTLGLHPHEAESFGNEAEAFLRKHLSCSAIVAVGEIGLDYYYNHAPKEAQRKAFDKQLGLAEEFKLPVQIHSREAEKDTLDFLKTFRGRINGLLHCFTGSYDMAKKALDLGFNISFSGILTFKNTDSLKSLCKKIPLNRMHIETDSPYLTPVPHRGKENQPAWVACVAYQICEIHQVKAETLSKQLKENTYKLFQKIPANKDKCLN